MAEKRSVNHDRPTSVKLSRDVLHGVDLVAEQLGVKRGVLLRELIIMGLSDYIARLHAGTTCRDYFAKLRSKVVSAETTCGDYEKSGTDLALNSSSPKECIEKDQGKERIAANKEGDDSDLLELWKISEPFSFLKNPADRLQLWSQSYPKVDLLDESRKIIAWWDANPSKRKTKRGVPRFVNAWLGRTASGDDERQTTTQQQPRSFAKIRKDERKTIWDERKKPGAYKTSR